MKFAWHNSNYKNADLVLLGVPDESGSHSDRKGSNLAPNRIRKISNEREVFEREKKTKTLPQICTPKKSLHDLGNIKKQNVSKTIEKITKDKKIPITIGGDHSITANILKGFDKLNKKISIIYFDAHPDFICSTKNYYGSVICDISKYKNIDFKSSIEVGIRQPEPEEIKNLRKQNLTTLYAIDLIDIKQAIKKIKSKVKNNVYISIDMDVLDPAFAPGVSSPVPGGITSNQLIYLLKELTKLNIVGLDIMETTPKYDIQDMTSHLATRLIIETLGCI